MSALNEEWDETQDIVWQATISGKTLESRQKHEKPHGLNVTDEELWSVLRVPSQAVFRKRSIHTETYKVRGLIRGTLGILIIVRRVQNELQIDSVEVETERL